MKPISDRKRKHKAAVDPVRKELVMENRTIPFTQFKRPNGHPVQTQWSPMQPVPDEVFRMAGELLATGATFEAEVLTTGEVSLSCGFADSEVPLAEAVCNNGLDVHDEIQALVREAYHNLTLQSRD